MVEGKDDEEGDGRGRGYGGRRVEGEKENGRGAR